MDKKFEINSTIIRKVSETNSLKKFLPSIEKKIILAGRLDSTL